MSITTVEVSKLKNRVAELERELAKLREEFETHRKFRETPFSERTM